MRSLFPDILLAEWPASSPRLKISDSVVQTCDFMKPYSTERDERALPKIGRPKTKDPIFWLAIPSVFRGKFGARVLNETIDSILQGANDAESSKMKLVIGLADSDVLKRRLLVSEICKQHHSLVEEGKLIMVSTPVDYYPPQLTTDRCKLARKEGDSLRRVLWRSKQLLDSTFLMEFIISNLKADLNVDFLLKLEDDSPVNPLYQRWMDSIWILIDTKLTEKSWSMLRLYDEYQDLLGATEMTSTRGLTAAFGLLFPMRIVGPMLDYMVELFDQMPVDWAIGAFLDEMRAENTFAYQGPGIFLHRESATSKVGVDATASKEVLDGAEIVDWAQCSS